MHHKHSASNDDLDIIDLDDDSDSDDDLIQLNLKSNLIDVRYSQLLKYSSLVRKECKMENAEKFLNEHLNKFINDYDIEEQSVILFFKIIGDEKHVKIDTHDFWNLWLLSDFFKSKKLTKNLLKYAQKHENDTNFIINIIINQNSPKYSSISHFYEEKDFNQHYEEMLKQNVNECLKCEDFGKLPISTIQHIIEESEVEFSSDSLYDFINQSIEERHILYQFLDIHNLSDEKFNTLYNDYNRNKSNPEIFKYFNYLKPDLLYIKELKEKIKKTDHDFDLLKQENDQLREDNKLLKLKKNKLGNKLNALLNKNDELKTENKIIFDVREDQFKNLCEENVILKEANISLAVEVAEIEKKIQDVSKKLNDKSQEAKKLSILSQNYTNILLFMAQNVPNLENLKESGKTLLHMACKSGDLNVVKYLLEHSKIDVCSKDIFFL